MRIQRKVLGPGRVRNHSSVRATVLRVGRVRNQSKAKAPSPCQLASGDPQCTENLVTLQLEDLCSGTDIPPWLGASLKGLLEGFSDN